ncbi:MAG: RidA family protein [Hyphomicrobiaceae bacterium]
MPTAVTYLNPPNAALAQSAYCQVARVKPGELAFVSGQVSVDAQGLVVGRGNFDNQFKQVFENIGRILHDLGAGYDDIVQMTSYLIEEGDISGFRDARARYFPEWFTGPLFPPHTLLIVRALASPEFLLEVEVVARLGD